MFGFGKKKSNDLIFVSIASYCDDDLANTVLNIIEQAKHPDSLRIVVCMQDETHKINDFKQQFDGKVETIAVPFLESKGCCWARAKIQEKYNDEGYYLQLDSHCRLVKDWDLVCKQWLIDTHAPKPLLTSYLIAFDNKLDNTDYLNEVKPYKLEAPLFYDNDKMRIEPQVIDDYLFYNHPISAKLFSAHFVFTYGKWVKEVPYDAELYFEGEEDTLGVRSYTHGWDMYHPHRAIGYHYYTRAGEVKHHDKVDSWHKSHEKSLQRMRHILGMVDDNLTLGKWGLGKSRNLQDYEKMAGINFAKRSIKGSIRNEIARKKIWSFTNGYFKRVEERKWHELQNNELVNEFIEIEHHPETLVLFDLKRNMYVRIQDNKSFFKNWEEEKGNFGDWVQFNSGFWNGEIKSVDYKNNLKKRFKDNCITFNKGNKSAIVSLRTPNTANWAQYAAVNQLAYAHQNKHDYLLYTDLVVIEDIPHWNKVKVLMELLPKYDYLVWMDSDAIVTNFDKKFSSYINTHPNKSLFVCNDIGGWQLNTGVMILKNTAWMNSVLQTLWKMDHIPHSKAAEQSSLIQLLSLNDANKEHWVVFDQTEFNCHPRAFKEGNFVLHMMGMSGEDRMKTFDIWNKKLGVYEIANTYNFSV